MTIATRIVQKLAAVQLDKLERLKNIKVCRDILDNNEMILNDIQCKQHQLIGSQKGQWKDHLSIEFTRGWEDIDKSGNVTMFFSIPDTQFPYLQMYTDRWRGIKFIRTKILPKSAKPI